MSSKENNRFRTKSIARALNLKWIRKLFFIFFGIDVLCLMALFFAYAYTTEIAEFGSYDVTNPVFVKKVSTDEGNMITLVLEDSEKEQQIRLEYCFLTKSAEYKVNRDGDTEKQADVTTIKEMLRLSAIAILIGEAFVLIRNFLFGVYAVRRELQPLDQMARVASELGSKTDYDQSEFNFDEAKVHNLEDAISRIKPDGPEGELHTTDDDLKGLEIAINGLLDRMRQSYKQQSRFVSDASHELRTPIAVIQGYVNMLDRWGKEDEKVLEEAIEAIKNESEHMKKLVEQLLFLARGDSGRNQFVLEKSELDNVIREVYEESLMIDEEHVYHFDRAAEHVEVIADVSMLKQAIRILVDNAAKYTPNKERITIGYGHDEKARPFVYVQDNGNGMAENELRHVFERFYRADDARESKTGGTGLGLSIAKWIIDRHGGFFEILSEKEIGTRIKIVLPQEQVQEEWSKHCKVDGRS